MHFLSFFSTLTVLIPVVLCQGIRFPDQDPSGGSGSLFLGSALAGLTRNQLEIFDSLTSQDQSQTEDQVLTKK